MNRIVSAFLILFIALPFASEAQFTPISGKEIKITYNPELKGIYSNLDSLRVVYAFDFWGNRKGTRLALRENILRPDPKRVHTSYFTKTPNAWEAVMEIDTGVSLLSYYITDGTAMDDNGGKTYTAYLYNSETMKPVPGAHYYMVPFLKLAGEDLKAQVYEAEQEIIAYPENFYAYNQYFDLYIQLHKGSPRAQQRIVNRLKDLEEQYKEDVGYLNLLARTYFYVLRDPAKAVEYKEMIDPKERWPGVHTIFDSKQIEKEQRERAMAMEQARQKLLSTAPPEINFITLDGGRMPVQDLAGKLVVLSFWASSSEKSIQLFDELKSLKTQYGDELEVFTVNIGESVETVQQFVSSHDYPFIFVMNQGIAVKSYGVEGLPQTYVLDRESIVREAVVGYGADAIPTITDALKKLR
ncbi:MAG: hypothetical protein CL946_08075 [Ectothiorhodospiraceae bacterium]|nr:hypothetical protein [Ectothiorhodospiraceae bacterium]